MLTLTQKTFFGPLSNPKNKRLPDLSVRETVALAPLVLFVFVIGFFPSIFIDRTKDSVLAFVEHYNDVCRAGRVDEPAARLLPPNSDLALQPAAPKPPEGGHCARGLLFASSPLLIVSFGALLLLLA